MDHRLYLVIGDIYKHIQRQEIFLFAVFKELYVFLSGSVSHAQETWCICKTALQRVRYISLVKSVHIVVCSEEDFSRNTTETGTYQTQKKDIRTAIGLNSGG